MSPWIPWKTEKGRLWLDLLLHRGRHMAILYVCTYARASCWWCRRTALSEIQNHITHRCKRPARACAPDPTISMPPGSGWQDANSKIWVPRISRDCTWPLPTLTRPWRSGKGGLFSDRHLDTGKLLSKCNPTAVSEVTAPLIVKAALFPADISP